ncbi:MAG: hypothetical protein ABSA10_09585, partial [Anaerolineales bacterium]
MNPLGFFTKILPGIFHWEFFQYSINIRIEGSVTSARLSPFFSLLPVKGSVFWSSGFRFFSGSPANVSTLHRGLFYSEPRRQ